MKKFDERSELTIFTTREQILVAMRMARADIALNWLAGCVS